MKNSNSFYFVLKIYFGVGLIINFIFPNKLFSQADTVYSYRVDAGANSAKKFAFKGDTFQCRHAVLVLC